MNQAPFRASAWPHCGQLRTRILSRKARESGILLGSFVAKMRTTRPKFGQAEAAEPLGLIGITGRGGMRRQRPAIAIASGV